MSADRHRRLSTPAVLAVALAVIVAVVASLVTLFRGGTPPPTALPTPSGSPHPVTPPPLPSHPPPPAAFPTLAPPTDVPLIWQMRTWEQTNEIRLHAFDWNGNEVGRFALPHECGGRCEVAPSPDGSLLLIPQGAGSAVDDIVDGAGRPVSSFVADGLEMWADDSRHLCLVHPQASTTAPGSAPSATDLSIVDALTGSSRKVATIAPPSWASTPGWGAEFVVSIGCSVASDRAVLVSDGVVVTAIWTVSLSNGHVSSVVSDPPPTPGPVCRACHLTGPAVATHDCSSIIENVVDGSSRLLDAATGTTAGWLPAADPPTPTIGVSWNHELAAVTEGVVDVTGQRAVWRAPSTLSTARPRPGSNDLVVIPTAVPGFDPQARIVKPDGSVIDLPPGDVL
jgi:hypothetical protein